MEGTKVDYDMFRTPSKSEVRPEENDGGPKKIRDWEERSTGISRGAILHAPSIS